MSGLKLGSTATVSPITSTFFGFSDLINSKIVLSEDNIKKSSIGILVIKGKIKREVFSVSFFAHSFVYSKFSFVKSKYAGEFLVAALLNKGKSSCVRGM